jgi:glycosyltransferase involved in cell wall biosynthesis
MSATAPAHPSRVAVAGAGDAAIRFSVCICTRNRPDDLRTALASVFASEFPANDVVVSDDSTDDRSRAMVAAAFASVTYVEGPRIGLGANRNCALAHARGTHVLFIDDDVVLAPDFLGGVAACLAGLGAGAARSIVGGTELNHGVRVFPHRVSFLGYQSIDYADGERRETVVINASVFPRAMFDTLRFDPSLVYGCDEMDVCVRAVYLHGYEIVFIPGLANSHFPSNINRDYYAPYMEASRIYVQFKRYYWVERRRAKAALFLAVTCLHMLAYFLRSRRWRGFAAFGMTVARSLGYIRACFSDRASHV